MIEINLIGDKSSKKGKNLNVPSLGGAMKKLTGVVNINTLLSFIIVAGISIWSHNFMSTKRTELSTKLAEQQQTLSGLRARKRKLAEQEKQIKTIEDQIADVRAKIRSVEKVFNSRLFPVPKLDAISQTLPKFVWLDRLSYEISGTAGRMEIEGSAISNDALSDFLSSLQEFPGFKRVNLKRSTHRDEKNYAYKQFRIEFKTEEATQ